METAVTKDEDMYSTLDVIERAPNRLLVEDTDKGKALQGRIDALKALVAAYRKGLIK